MMFEKFIIGMATFCAGFFLKSFIMSAKEKHDVKENKRKHLNEMKEQYHKLADDIGKRAAMLLNQLDTLTMQNIRLEEVIDFRLSMDKYIQHIEAVSGSAYDNHFDSGAFEREFLEECKKIASKTIPSIYSLTNDLMKAHSIQHSVDLSTLCPNLLRLLEGKLSPDEFNRIRGFYQP